MKFGTVPKMKEKNIGRGARHRGSQLRIMCAFDEDTFGEIRIIALRRSTSMAQVIRELVEFGLLDVEGSG